MNDDIAESIFYIPTLEELIDKTSKIIEGQENLVNQVCLCVYKYLIKTSAYKFHIDLPNPSNLLIQGRTGTGKTYTVRTVCQILDIPFIEINGKSICQEGWSGTSLKDFLVDGLRAIHDFKGYAVIFIDEFDKMIMPQRSSNFENHSAVIQGSILKYIEGIELILESKNEIKIQSSKQSHKSSIYTGNLCWLFAGAFNELRVESSKRQGIGFVDAFTNSDIKDELTDKLIEIGMLPEIAGRITSFAQTKDFTEDMYRKVLKNDTFVAKKWAFVLNIMGFSDLSFDVYEEDLINRAVKKNLGVRGLLQVTEEMINESLLNNKKNVSINIYLNRL